MRILTVLLLLVLLNQVVTSQDTTQVLPFDASHLASFQPTAIIHPPFNLHRHLMRPHTISFCGVTTLLCFATEKGVFTWDFRTKAMNTIGVGLPEKSVLGLASVGDVLIIATDSFVQAINIQTAERVDYWSVPEMFLPITVMAMNRSQTKIILGHAEGYITIWPYESSFTFDYYEVINHGDIWTSLAVALNETSDVIGGGLQTQSWNTQTQTSRFISSNAIVDVEFDLSGRYAAIIDEVSLPQVWDTQTHAFVDYTLIGDMNQVGRNNNLAFHPSENFFVVVATSALLVWDMDQHEIVAIPDLWEGNAVEVTFSPDGLWMAVRYEDGRIQIFEVTIV